MDRNEFTLKAVVEENVALKAQVESLEIRLAAAKDQVASLQQFIEGETAMRRAGEEALENATKSLNAVLKSVNDTRRSAAYFQQQNRIVDDENEELRKELMRRGADDPYARKPSYQTTMAALSVVCKWDRDECLADLKKQRWEHLRRIDVLKLGQDTFMDDVVKGMRQQGSLICDGYMEHTLYEVLTMLRAQLQRLYSSDSEWSEYPLCVFVDDAEDNMVD